MTGVNTSVPASVLSYKTTDRDLCAPQDHAKLLIQWRNIYVQWKGQADIPRPPSHTCPSTHHTALRPRCASEAASPSAGRQHQSETLNKTLLCVRGRLLRLYSTSFHVAQQTVKRGSGCVCDSLDFSCLALKFELLWIAFSIRVMVVLLF